MKLYTYITLLCCINTTGHKQSSNYFIAVTFNDVKITKNTVYFHNNVEVGIDSTKYYDITTFDYIKVLNSSQKLICPKELLEHFYNKGGDSTVITIDFYDSSHRKILNIPSNINFSYGFRIESESESWTFYQ